MHLGQHSHAVIIAANEVRVHTTYKLVIEVTRNSLSELITNVIEGAYPEHNYPSFTLTSLPCLS